MANNFIHTVFDGISSEIEKLDIDNAKKRYLLNKLQHYFDKLDRILHTLIDSLEEGIIVVDENLKIVNANKTFLSWLEKEKEEIINKPLTDFFNISTLEEIEKTTLNIYITYDKYIPIKAKIQKIDVNNRHFFRIITQNLEAIHKIQRKLKSILKLYRVLNLINQEILRAQSIEEIYSFAVETLVKEGVFDFAFIADIEDDKVIIRTAYGNDAYEKYLNNTAVLDIKKIKDFRNVIATKEHFENESFNENEYERLYEYKITFPIYKDEYSVATLIKHSEIKALLVGYFKNKKDFNPHFISILKQIAHDIGYAILMLQNRENIKYLAYYDILTNLPNRRYFFEKLESTLKMLHEKNQNGALILIDINKFKNINESLGFYAGDLILIKLSEILKKLIKKDDLIARVGSDEFGLFIGNVKNEEELYMLLKEKLNNFEFVFDVDEKEVLVTLSIGAAFYPKDADTKEMLFTKAEAAVKEIKKKGKGFLSYNKKIKQISIERITLESELLQAIENDEFEMHYQPIIDIKNKKIHSFEALIRWNSPKRGLVSPGVFIPILEETGLINEVGGMILNKICSFIKKTDNVKVAVNVSVRQLHQKQFADDLINEIKNENIDPKRVVVEITESVLMENIDSFIYDIYKLNSEGIDIEIDDFGTGYSSLAYLKKLPVFALKIDRTFIKDLPFDKEDEKITKAIISLGHTLDKKIIAEGVENYGQLNLLKNLECDFVQGFLFAKPMPEKKAIDYLKNFNFDDIINSIKNEGDFNV